jgi:hypothetical protein
MSNLLGGNLSQVSKYHYTIKDIFEENIPILKEKLPFSLMLTGRWLLTPLIQVMYRMAEVCTHQRLNLLLHFCITACKNSK